MRHKHINLIFISTIAASTFLLYNNFTVYRENPASDLLLEYDRLQGEIADKKLSENGLKYLNRVKLEISNRIAYRLKIQDCNQLFNEHPHADNGKYILYPEGSTNSKAVFLCEKNMNGATEKKLLDLKNSGRPSRMPAQENQLKIDDGLIKSFDSFVPPKQVPKKTISKRSKRNKRRS